MWTTGAFSTAFFACFNALGYLDFRYASEAWRERHKRLAVWYEDFAKRRAMQLTVPKDAA